MTPSLDSPLSKTEGTTPEGPEPLNPEPVVSIVIVNYNGRAFLPGCLESIQAHVTVPHEVVVVDNASHDGSAAWLKAAYPWVRVVESAQNLGFAGGNNLGVSASRGHVVLLLNHDTLLQTEIRPVVEALRNPEVGAAGVHLRYGDGRVQRSVGHEHTPLRIVASWVPGLGRLPGLRREHPVSEFYNQSHADVDWVCGACMALRRADYQALGGLDADFFMYVEDVDLCRRVRQAGWRIVYVPEVVVTHLERGGQAWAGERALRWTSASYLRYVGKYFGARARRRTRSGLRGVMRLRQATHVLQARLARGASARLAREKANGFQAVADWLGAPESASDQPFVPAPGEASLAETS